MGNEVVPWLGDGGLVLLVGGKDIHAPFVQLLFLALDPSLDISQVDLGELDLGKVGVDDLVVSSIVDLDGNLGSYWSAFLGVRGGVSALCDGKSSNERDGEGRFHLV